MVLLPRVRHRSPLTSPAAPALVACMMYHPLPRARALNAELCSRGAFASPPIPPSPPPPPRTPFPTPGESRVRLSPPHSSHTFPNPGHNSCSAAPPLPPPAPVAAPPPFTGARCCVGPVSEEGGGNGKQARQPGIFTRRLPLHFALADVRGPGLKALATAARRTVCASVWFVQPAPLARCSPLSRAIYWQSSSHNRDTSQHMHRSLSRSLSSPVPPPAAAPSSRLPAPSPLLRSWPPLLPVFLFRQKSNDNKILHTTRRPASCCFVSLGVHCMPWKAAEFTRDGTQP